jgi:acetolactate synthase-1/2/3 large subunit
MALPALAVAAEFGLGVTWVVLDDQALGSIRDIQEHRFAGRILATDFGFQPDFAALARACGAHGERVEDAGAVDAAIARALEANARGVPAVLDVAVARERLRGSLEHYAFYPDALVQAAR